MAHAEGVIEKSLDKYGVSYSRIGPPEKGYRSTSYPVFCENNTLNLIIYKNEAGILRRIKSANKTGQFLSDSGLPARRPSSKQILKIKFNNQTRYAALYSYLPGNTIPWEAYTMEHIKNLGQTMAAMHKLLAGLDKVGFHSTAIEYQRIVDSMNRYFSDLNVSHALKTKLRLKTADNDFSELLKATGALPEQQVIHMDFVRGNVLFQSKKISGIIDFEKASIGSPLLDIARTLAFLIIDCKYKEEAKIRKYFLQSGYQKRGGQSIQKYDFKGTNLLDQLIKLFIFHDFYKFLKSNPYETLNLNEHFVRTRAYLLSAGLLTKA